MDFLEAKVRILKDHSEEFSEFLDALQVSGYYEILFDREDSRKPDEPILSDYTNIKVYLNPGEPEKELKLWIYLKAKCLESFFMEVRPIETREYEESYKEFYKPFQIGKYEIIPTWEKDSQSISPNSIPVYINPGLAFGTGHHETTRLVLDRMGGLRLEEKKVLDMGAGSGILSIAAGKSGAASVMAVDIDPNAVQSTRFNLSENSFPKLFVMEVLEGGFDLQQVQGSDFDLVIANITFAVLANNIRSIASLRSNHFLFSGVITEKKEEFLALLDEYLPGNLIFSADWNGWEILEWIKNQ